MKPIDSCQLPQLVCLWNEAQLLPFFKLFNRIIPRHISPFRFFYKVKTFVNPFTRGRGGIQRSLVLLPILSDMKSVVYVRGGVYLGGGVPTIVRIFFLLTCLLNPYPTQTIIAKDPFSLSESPFVLTVVVT